MVQSGVLKHDISKSMFMDNSAIKNENIKIWEMLGMLNPWYERKKSLVNKPLIV